MSLLERIETQFAQSQQVKQATIIALAARIVSATERLATCLRGGGKIMACGNGGSAADAQHFVAELVNRFEIERPALAALALTTNSSNLTSIGNDYCFEDIFAKELRALGKRGDCLLAISTSGNSVNVLAAAQDAQKMGIDVIALTGNAGGKMNALLLPSDIHLCVPSHRTARIQETHLLILHCLCDGIDHLLYEGVSQ